MFLTLNRGGIRGDAGLQWIRHLVETYFRDGGFHIHAATSLLTPAFTVPGSS